jgi:predicted small secreted protein
VARELQLRCPATVLVETGLGYRMAFSKRSNAAMNRNYTTLCVWLLAASIGGACANTVRGVKQDTERATENTAAAAQTVDVKSALIADGRVDATNINVDTIASTRTVVLKGSVPTADQKATAESIAREKAKGYTITNQLTVAPK